MHKCGSFTYTFRYIYDHGYQQMYKCSSFTDIFEIFMTMPSEDV